MIEDNENGETKGNGEEETALTFIVPPFPLTGDDINKDYFLSQFISSLYKAGFVGGDPNFWFGRLIAMSSAGDYYVFTLNGVDYSMSFIMNLVKNREFVFQFISLGTPTYSGNVATITATFDLFDYRTPTSSRTRFTNVTFTHIIRPTYVTYSTIIG